MRPTAMPPDWKVAAEGSAFRSVVSTRPIESVENLARAVRPVDICHNAGILLYQPLIDLAWEDLERATTDLTGAID
jgi:hypothetical protein